MLIPKRKMLRTMHRRLKLTQEGSQLLGSQFLIVMSWVDQVSLSLKIKK